ncbi:MAG: adenylosuccinate lyase [Chloroflexota bacterium]
MIERYSRPEMKAVWADENKFDQWLRVEIAACEAWADLGRIPSEALPAIRTATYNLDRMAEFLKVTHHDMTAFLKAVAETVGEEARFIHLGLTSSDIMDTALGLQLQQATAILKEGARDLAAAIQKRALEHQETIMMGRTHGVHAEPTTLGLKLALWWEEMKRNIHRLDEADQVVSVGKLSGAVGTYATVPPEVEEGACKRLGLSAAPVSSQIVQRDRHAQFVTTLALLASSLEKFATELRSLQRTEVLEIEEPFESGQTGSSAMPHKRNPELCERICGLARLVRGHALTSLENVALWHERDISHSSNERITLPDSCLVLDYILALFASVVRGMTVHTDNMRRNLDLSRGLVFSQRVLLALIDKGMSREQAYGLVQEHAMRSWQQGKSFRSLLQGDPQVTAVLAKSELDPLFDYSYYVRYVDMVFRRIGLVSDEESQTTRQAHAGSHSI